MKCGRGAASRLAGRVVFSAAVLALLLPTGAQAGPAGAQPTGSAWWPKADDSHLGAHVRSVLGRFNRSMIECVTAPSEAKNMVLDCPAESSLPNRETAIAVDPSNPEHMIEASIDGPFGQQNIEFATTFDGGDTWTIGDVPREPSLSDFDPWVSFDVKHGVVILSFQGVGPNEGHCPPPGAQFVTTSADGGLNWGDPVTVQTHQGCPGISRNVAWLYEGKIATDNSPASPYYGRTWLTGGWIGCRNTTDCTFPTVETHTDDGGATWSKPRSISGSNSQYCTASPHPPRCDGGVTPALPLTAPDGSVSVMFGDLSHDGAWEPNEILEEQLMVVHSTDGGQTWSPPVHVTDLENGSRDFDCNESLLCRLTGTALDPIFGANNSSLARSLDGTLYLAFSDNRNGLHDVDHPVSNTDVFLMTSADGGETWTGPDMVASGENDQYKPSLAVNPVTGELGILFYDRSDTPNKTMNVTLATGAPGDFDLTRITTAASHVSDDLWLTYTLRDCHRCTWHVGEYIGLAYGSDGTANMTWTDLRRFVTLPNGRRGYTMNIDYAMKEMDRP